MRAVNRWPDTSATIVSSLLGGLVLAGSGVAGTLVFERAGAALLVAAPFLSGFVAAFARHELGASARLRHSAFAALSSLVLVAVSSALLARDSALYILMAMPPAAVLAFLGALMGHSTAQGRPSISPVIALLMCWPLLAAADARHPDQREVRTIIEVAGNLERLTYAALENRTGATERWQLIAGIAHPGPERELLVHELDEGRTRIEARTSYALDIYPARYWSLWSDAILRRMQARRLAQIKREAECPQPTAAAN